jgi:sugar lactone lactonase YvrE
VTRALRLLAGVGLLAATLVASEGDEHQEQIRRLEARLRVAPDQGEVLFRLSRARALAGDSEGALADLAKAIATGLDFDIDAESAFRPLNTNPKFMELLDRALEQRLVVHQSREAFRVAEKDLIPEGLAHDPASGAFFLGSLYKRKVVRVGADGRVRDFTASGQDGLWQVLGMKVDAARHRLWVVTAAGEEAGPQEGCSAVLVYDLATGTLARRYSLDNEESRHFLNDIALAADGRAFVTDSRTGGVWRIDPGRDGFTALVKPFTFDYPNGLALSADEHRLYVADGTKGISIVDPESGGVRPLSHPGNVSLYGIDGLYVHASGLIGVQNGAGTERIVRYRLDREGSKVLWLDVLESRNPVFAIPTTGVVVGASFYYIANSRIDQLAADGRLKSGARLEPVVVLEVPLE